MASPFPPQCFSPEELSALESFQHLGDWLSPDFSTAVLFNTGGYRLGDPSGHFLALFPRNLVSRSPLPLPPPSNAQVTASPGEALSPVSQARTLLDLPSPAFFPLSRSAAPPQVSPPTIDKPPAPLSLPCYPPVLLLGLPGAAPQPGLVPVEEGQSSLPLGTTATPRTPLVLAESSSSIFSQEGIQQGDPLGPFFSSLALQAVTSGVPQVSSSSQPNALHPQISTATADSAPFKASYLDHIHICGSPTSVALACKSVLDSQE